MIAYQVEFGRWHQGGQLLHEFERLEHNVRRSVAPAVPEAVQEPPVRQARQTLRRHRRAGGGAAQLLQLPAGPSGNADVCVQAESDTLAQRDPAMTSGVSSSIECPRVMTGCPARGPEATRPCTEAPYSSASNG